MATKTVANQILENQDKDGMLRRALERIIQLYTDSAHFVYELLQNAEDAGATKIKFEQFEDKLVVSHDGLPFTAENLQSICDIGSSDKVEKLNQIGQFGVGFKSVFGICDTVYLYSHPISKEEHQGYNRYAVRIDDFTRPVDVKDKKIEKGYTTQFVFPYCVGQSFSSFKNVDKLNEKLSDRLQNLGITTLLFMKNLQTIEYVIELPDLKKSGFYMLDKNALNDHCVIVSALGETESTSTKETSSYLVFTRPVKNIQEDRTIDIAFEMSIGDDGNYNFKPTTSPNIFVYFPTETESKLQFIVQGPYRTTPDRSNVPADDEGNKKLAAQTANLLYDCIIELRNAGKLNYSLLNILPIDSTKFSYSPLFFETYIRIKRLMLTEKVFLCRDGSYASRNSVKIARGEKFAALFTDSILSDLFNDGIRYRWLPSIFTESNTEYKKLYEFLTTVLNIAVLRPENLRSVFNHNSEFFLTCSNSWLIKLYKFYEGVPGAFSKEDGSSMLTAKFIKTAKGTIEAPYRRSDGRNIDYQYYYYDEDDDTDYQRNLFIPTDNYKEIPNVAFVDPKIYSKCKRFFKETLNLIEPDEYEMFISDFKKNYKRKSKVSLGKRLSDLKRLLYYMDKEEYREEVHRLIKECLPLRCKNDGRIVYKTIDEGRICFAVSNDGLSVKEYYRYIEELDFIDEEYYDAQGITTEMLSTLGIGDNGVIHGLKTTSGEYDQKGPGKNPEWHTEGDFRWNLTLDSLKQVLEYIEDHPDDTNSMIKSATIFSFLRKYEKHLHGYLYVGGKIGDQPDSYSDIVRILKKDWYYIGSSWTGKWLYTKDNNLVSQEEITKMELSPMLYGDVREDTRVFEYLGFQRCEEDDRLDYKREYDQMDSIKKNWMFEEILRSEYGMTRADLEAAFTHKDRKKQMDADADEEDDFTFPSVPVRNMDKLRKHAAEVLAYASPVEYQKKIRSIRVSRNDSSIDSYLRSMYELDNKRFACQMCHLPVSSFEKCQIMPKMETELDPMHLCLCNNCAVKYNKLRRKQLSLEEFRKQIEELDDNHILRNPDPVSISFEKEEIWFTQTHVAEIKELLDMSSQLNEKIK